MKVTIPKPRTEEGPGEDEENVETEVNGVEHGEEEDVNIAAKVKESDAEKSEPKNDENGAGDDDGDKAKVVEEEQEQERGEKKAKCGAKSTTVIIARTHPGEPNTSFIVQGW